MRGEFIGVWSETWREIWFPLIEHDDVPDDIFCELYRELAPALKESPTVEILADIIDDPLQSSAAFKQSCSAEFSSEQSLVNFFETAFDVLDDLQGDLLSNRYFILLNQFIEKFSLRYDLRRPCMLCPTLPGFFAGLVRSLRHLANQDGHLCSLMNGYEESIRDLRYGATEERMKTCMNKQFMLLEALGSLAPEVTKSTLGAMCDELRSWPHATIRESLKKMYGFASDYPGIRHGGNAASKIREIDMRDMVAISILLTGFSPYLNNSINANTAFWGSGNE